MGKSIRVAKGKEVFEIDAQDLPFAAKDGFLPTERIIVANSKTKESFEIDPADYLNAVNDGFEFADLAKKKEPIPSNLPPSPVPSPSPSDGNIEQPVTIQQIRELKVPQFEQVLGGSMVAPSQPIQKDNPELKPAIEKYAAQYGLTDRDVETIVEDFDWADDSFVRNLGVMKQRSPEEFYRTIDAYYVRQSLPKEKQAQFNNLQSYGDLQGLQSNMQILWKDLQGNREAQERLLRMNQSYINPSNLDVRVAAQKFNSENRDKIGRDLSRYEYAGLKTLEVFNPELAQSYINELRTGSEWAGAKKTERNAQLERIALQLETIGRENTIRAAKQTNEVISFYKKQMDAAATPEEKQSVAELMQADPIVKAAPKIAEELEELQLAESFDDKAYPTLRAIDAVQVYNQTRRKGMSALDVAAAMPIGFVSGLGKYAEGTLNTIDNVIGAVVLGDEDILRRDMLKRGEMTIGTADDKRYGQQSLFSVDANFSKQIESVLADESLTPDEKKAKTIDLIYKNPDKYKLNPNADKFDLNAQTVLLGGSELMGEILGLALLQRGMGAGVNAPKYKNLAATLGSTGVAMYDDFYKQALIRNSKSPALEASLDVAIAWLSETISPDYKIVRKVLGKSNSPVIAGITEETWNAIRSRLPQAAVATIRGLSKAISTAIPESFEEMSGAAMTQAKERGVFGRETAKPDATNAEKAVFGEGINPFIDDVVNAGVTTLATMAVPSTVSLISNAKGVSFEDKSRLYALGVRGEAGLPADMPEKIRKVVTEMQTIVANIKDNYPELNEKQRTEMAFNMYRKKAIQADKATMTEKQKEQADKAIIEADDAIEATVAGEKAVIEQIDGDAKVETDAIDKKIESLNPESEGYKEKKAELKEEKATIKQTAEERKAALKEAVRAAFPQTPTNEPTTTEANQPTAEIEGATNPQQIEAGTPAGVQPGIGGMGQGRPAGNVAVEGNEALRDAASSKGEPDILIEAVSTQKELDAFLKKNKKYIKNGKVAADTPESVREKGKELLARLNLLKSKVNDEFERLSKENKNKSKQDTDKLNSDFDRLQKEAQKDYGFTDDEVIEATIDEKLNFGDKLTPSEVAWANENMFRPQGYDFGESGLVKSTAQAAQPQKKSDSELATDFDKAMTASSRFRPKERVVFDKPIVGPNGNKLVSYEWAYEWTMLPNNEGEAVSKRISDWTQAESSAETGRDIVHKFTVERKDGTVVTVSSETIPSLLGYTDAKQMKGLPSIVSAVKTLAKQRMQLAIMAAQEKEYNDLVAKYEAAEKPQIKEIDEPVSFAGVQDDWREGRHKVFAMGEVWHRQDNKYDYNSKSYVSINSPTKDTIDALKTAWVQQMVKNDGGKYPQGIYDLRRRVERQEKKVLQAAGSTITINDTAEQQPSQPIPQSQAEPAGNVAAGRQYDGADFVDNNDGTGTVNGFPVKYIERKDSGKRVYSADIKDITKVDKEVFKNVMSAIKEVNRQEADRANKPKEAERTFRYSNYNKSNRMSETVAQERFVEEIGNKMAAGVKYDEATMRDYETIKNRIADRKRDDETASSQSTPESGDIKAAGKAAADFIRTLRPPSNTAQSNILGLPIAVYDTAIVAIANAVEAGATVAQAIADVVADLQRQFPNWKESNKFATEVEWAGKMRPFILQQVAQFPDLTTEEIMEVIAEEAPHLIATPEQEQAVKELVNKSIEDYAVQEQSAEGVDVRQQAEDGEGMGEGNAEIPPTPPTGEQVGSDEEGPKLRDKGILNRLYNAEQIPQQAREAFKDNLKYEPKSQVEAEKIAQGIIAEFGIDEAVLRAEAGTFHGDVNSMIFATALNQLYEQESKAQGDEKVAIAKKFADISMRYDEAARSGGRFISAIGYFYKKSPLGMRMLEEANRNEQFKEWIKSKENDYRAFFEELMKEPEVQEMVEKEVRERLKKERAQKRTERKKKVNDAIDKWINDLGKQTYSSVVPPTVLIPVLKAAKGLYNAGESVLEIVEKAVDSIDEKMNGADWDRDAFRTKLTGMLDEAESADELKRQRAIEKFRNKLKGLSEEQKDKLIRKSLRKLVADGALEFDDFKKMLADIIGMGEMSPEEIAAFEQTVKDMNAAADVADEIANAETLTPEMMQRYNEARVKAEKAAIAYGDLVYNKPDITKRLLSYLQLAPLGIKALVTNPFYNVWQHVAVRIPTAVVGNVVDTILYRASQVGNSIWGTDVLYPKNDPRNIAEVQKQFFKGGFLGTKKAMSQVVTGLTDKDYIQKDMYNSRNKPLVAIRDIFNQLTKKKLMTNKQIFDKMLQGTLGITMEGVARLLNVGDKPMRYAAERAEAARFAKELGLKDLELDFFMELPREIAFREYKKRGMTDEAAGEKADEIVDGIIKSGEKSVFQGDNILATAIDSFFEKFGLTGRIFRVLNLPYVKTPLNSLWSLYNLVNPYVALAQVTFYGGRAVANKSRKDYEESKYWLGHAVSGFALHALMGALVQYGIFSPPDEDDESKREREGRKTYNPNGKVNITKLMAFLDGGDPNAVKNGVIVDIQYFGVMGVLGAMITKKNQEMTEEQRKNGMTFIENQLMNLDITTKHFIDQGIFGQTSLAIEAFQKRGAALDQWLLGMINMGTNVVQPAMYAQISRAQLPYYSRQKADDFKGQVKNSMLARSSVLRGLMGEMPPSKIGVWGDTMSKGGSEFMDVMGRLFGVTRENDDNFAQPIYEDYMKYNDPLFFPPALKPELDGKKLTAQQYDDLQIFVGQQRKELVKPFVNDGATVTALNKKYSEFKSKEDKIRVLSYLYDVGKENGLVLFRNKYKEFQKPFEGPTYESIMKKLNDQLFETFNKSLPRLRN